MLAHRGRQKGTIMVVIVDAAQSMLSMKLLDVSFNRNRELPGLSIKRWIDYCYPDEFVVTSKDEESSADVQVQQ